MSDFRKLRSPLCICKAKEILLCRPKAGLSQGRQRSGQENSVLSSKDPGGVPDCQAVGEETLDYNFVFLFGVALRSKEACHALMYGRELKKLDL